MIHRAPCLIAILCVFLLASSHAFVMPSKQPHHHHHYHHHDAGTTQGSQYVHVPLTNHCNGFSTSTVALCAQKPKSGRKDEPAAAASAGPTAKEILVWLSPLNPYMLFVYPLLFIFLVDALHLGPGGNASP
jgi:hypothetical protein